LDWRRVPAIRRGCRGWRRCWPASCR
jgi:hypothetical protein